MTCKMKEAICFTLLGLSSAEKCWRKVDGCCGTSTQAARRGVGSVRLTRRGLSDTSSSLNAPAWSLQKIGVPGLFVLSKSASKMRQELQQASEEPPSAKPEDSDGEGDVQHSDQDSDDDDFFASQTAKYLVWLGQVVSEADNHYALYVMQIVSRSKNTVNAFALHCSKPATRKDCIGSVMFNIVTPITSLFVQGKIHSDKQNSRNTQEGRGCNLLFRTRETRQTPRKIENADQEFARLSVPYIRSFDKNFANNHQCSLFNEAVLLMLNCF